MYLSRLSLTDFRNYRQLDLPLGPGLYLFHGENAQGKTNLLEAVSMLATATSFHASGDREVVNWLATDHITRLDATVQRQEGSIQLEMIVIDPTPPTFQTTGIAPLRTRSIELPAHSPRKRYKVNGVPRRTLDLIGQMKVVLFAPSDLHLVDGSPDERRRFMDRALCQLQPRYSQALVTYRKIVSQRSALLKRIRENQEDPKMLNYLDEQMTQLANQIIYERVHMINALNEWANQFQQTISGGREQLQIIYRPSFRIDPHWSPVEAPQHYREQLLEIRKREISQGVCLRGPHRDELEFLVNDVNMLPYGSRGQQRTAALAAKLSELTFMQTSTGDQPILLLDDVFSELDSLRREYLLAQISHYEQVMLTSTDLESFPSELAQHSYRYRVTDGTLIKE